MEWSSLTILIGKGTSLLCNQNIMKKHSSIYISIVCCILFAVIYTPNMYAQTNKEKLKVKQLLQSEYFEHLYSRTYYSLVDRMDSDGYLPESLTRAYPAMFPRTTGPFVFMLMETNKLQEAEQTIDFVLKAIDANEMERIPRIIGKNNKGYTIVDDQHQIDGQAHVILAWARLAVKRGNTKFEDRTWKQMRALMRRTCDRTCFQYGNDKEPTRPCLVKNVDFEHSRDGRAWDTWDLLTQSFVGASLEEMIKIAERRGDKDVAEDWKKKLDILKKGISRQLVIERFGKPTYLEMLQQTPNGREPLYGMGWVCLSPIAAGWEAMDRQVMVNTVDVMEKLYLKKSHGVIWMPTDGYTQGRFSNEMIGKGIGWEIDFANTEKRYGRIVEILEMIEKVNANNPIYMEGAWLEGNNIRINKQITDEDLLDKMETSVWKVKDAGNGEQTAWWCWAMARLRKAVDLSALPKRIKNQKN